MVAFTHCSSVAFTLSHHERRRLMPPQTAHLAGIGSIPPHLAKTVLARLFPVLSAPSQKAVRERLNDTHPECV